MIGFLKAIFKIIAALLMTVFSIAIVISLATLYLIATPSGGKLLVGFFLEKYGTAASLTVGSYEGSITQGFILKDITLSRLPNYPDALTRIQQARIQLPFGTLDWHKMSVSILNGRIFLPQSDPIVFGGKIENGQIDANVFSRSLDVKQLTKPFLSPDDYKYLQGFVTNIDLIAKGSILGPHVMGHLLVDKITFKTTTVSDGFGRVDFVVTQWGERPLIKGEVGLDAGLIVARHISLDLQKSRVYFLDDTYNPKLDVHAGTKIEDIQIDFALKGTYLKPELVLSSDPPMSEDVLFVVLATGKSRHSVGSSTLTGGTLSGELVGDFMDYLLLGGSGDALTRQYETGSDFDDSSKKLGFRKHLTEDLKVGFGVEQLNNNQVGQSSQPTTFQQSLEGEMAVSDGLSLNVSKKVRQSTTNDTTSRGPEQGQQSNGETQIYLKYKHNF